MGIAHWSLFYSAISSKDISRKSRNLPVRQGTLDRADRCGWGDLQRRSAEGAEEIEAAWRRVTAAVPRLRKPRNHLQDFFDTLAARDRVFGDGTCRHGSLFDHRRSSRHPRIWNRRFGRGGRKNGAQVTLLQRSNAIANARGAFEFEIFRGFAHLRFELRDGLHHLRFAGDFANRQARRPARSSNRLR